ncbi:MAG: hypothetical protein KDN20_14320 [Verrucomicrobiae bacterium]|nr:hypothetical protein [Verrucomicrobiae bacterium]
MIPSILDPDSLDPIAYPSLRPPALKGLSALPAMILVRQFRRAGIRWIAPRHDTSARPEATPYQSHRQDPLFSFPTPVR